MFIRSNPRFSRPHPRRLGAALLSLALVLPAPLVAQDSAAPAGPAEPSQTTAAARPGLFDILTLDRISTAAMQMVMSSARLFADIRYGQVSLDPLAARMTLLDLDIRPYLPGLPPGACIVTAGRVTIAGQPLDRPEAMRLRMSLDDMELGLGCLPAEARALVMGVGLDRLTMPRADIGLRYDYASGGAIIDLAGDLDNVAAIEAFVDADYISFRVDPATEEPQMALELNAAHVTLDDRGAWTMAQRLMPPDMRAPEALQALVAGAVAEMLDEANGIDAAQLSEAQQRFAAEAGAAARGFAEGNRRVVLATGIARPPFRIDEDSAAEFQPLFDALAPVAGHHAPRLDRVIPVAELRAALETDALPDNALELGRAMLTGVGAPRNLTSGLNLLAQASRQGNAEAAFLVAEALAADDPETAYGHAMRAAAAAYPGALAVLDRAERGTPFARMMAMQADASPAGPDPALYGSVLEMRRAARGFLTGTGRYRSYRAAWYWAAMAAAAGDASGAAMRDEITELMRLRGDAAAWAAEAASLDNGVLRDWIDKDLPAQLK
ncbi:hypothetical protein [Marinibacterium profundimaris]|uniref:Sel1 repeat family protein n=1 Tax=Marinibacterium profundimaris TaxID=1679460 RepID=A0A225NRN3_9RHOB|nr:hypothetical protein [Marinibacterium profundimaris]OWU77499.1 hypothetical protein ATO3_02030 [Marinibacterium profundimaris]